MQLGDTVLHAPDGRIGTLVSYMRVVHLDPAKPLEERFIVEYQDAAGSTTQAWFDEAALVPMHAAPEG